MKRNGYIDTIRGLNLISMIIFHAIWDIVYIFGVDLEWYKTGMATRIWQNLIAWTFVLLSGYCYRFSKHKLKNGIKVSTAGAIISIVTYIVMPESLILFGVLTMLGSCMIILLPFIKWMEKVKGKYGIIVSFILFIFTFNISSGYIGLGDIVKIRMPRQWYANLFTTYIGFTKDDFFSTDYFAIIPWIFLYIVGYYMNKCVSEHISSNKEQKGKKLDKDTDKDRINDEIFAKSKVNIVGILGIGIRFLGKHSLIVYMLHQPIVYFLGMLFFK